MATPSESRRERWKDTLLRSTIPETDRLCDQRGSTAGTQTLRKLNTAYDELGKMRTLLIWGDRDRAVIAKSAYELQKRLPNSELVMLKGVGHLPYEEAPDQFNETVIRSLTS